MRGNSHVRFLGGEDGATRPTQPTGEGAGKAHGHMPKQTAYALKHSSNGQKPGQKVIPVL
jgi:hypothetical protein